MRIRDYTRGSDGTGEAVRAIVTEDRGVGNLDLIVDSVLRMPARFIGTTGFIDPQTGLIDEEDSTVMICHLEGSIVRIDEFAPGYSDIGNFENQVLVLKPTTAWADAVSDSLYELIQSSPTPPADPQDADLWIDESEDNYGAANLLRTAQVPSGSVDGVNALFTLAEDYAAGTLAIYLNGVRQKLSADFTESGSNTFTFVDPPETGSSILVDYQRLISTAVPIESEVAFVNGATPTEAPNGVISTFTLNPYIGGSMEVYVNGVFQRRGTDFSENATGGTITFIGILPPTGAAIRCSYQQLYVSLGGADMVDGFHASATPEASKLLVLDGNAKIPEEAIPDNIWKEVARYEATSTQDVLEVTGIPAYDQLRVTFILIASGAVINADFYFNGDQGSNYAGRYTVQNGADLTGVNITGLPLESGGTKAEYPSFTTLDILNLQNKTKLVHWLNSHIDNAEAGTGIAPRRLEGNGKWVNTTARINKISLRSTNASSFATGSRIIVEGRN